MAAALQTSALLARTEFAYASRTFRVLLRRASFPLENAGASDRVREVGVLTDRGRGRDGGCSVEQLASLPMANAYSTSTGRVLLRRTPREVSTMAVWTSSCFEVASCKRVPFGHVSGSPAENAGVTDRGREVGVLTPHSQCRAPGGLMRLWFALGESEDGNSNRSLDFELL